MVDRLNHGKYKELLSEIASACLVTRTRVAARVLTGLYDDAYRRLGINAPQLILLTIIARIGPVSRAEIGRLNQQDPSTLSRNIKLLANEGWIEEIRHLRKGRARPMAVTSKGRDLLVKTAPAWRGAQKRAKVLLGPVAAEAILGLGDRMMNS